MWFTRNYGLPVEHPVDDQPGITLNGGEFGTDPILAELADAALHGVQTDLEERVAELETSIAAVAGVAAVTLGTFDGGAGTNVTTIFTDIDQTFAHLLVYWRGRNDASNSIVTCSMRFNGDGGSNYHSEQARTAGSSWSHNANANTTSVRVGYVGSQSASHGKIFIPEYSNFAGNTTKSAHGESHARGVDGSSTNNSWGCGAGYWNSTAAITSIQLWPAGQLWGINVRATLIGIREG